MCSSATALKGVSVPRQSARLILLPRCLPSALYYDKWQY